MSPESEHGVDLYWLPLGAGGHSVRLNGLVFEAVVARLERRTACDLYHSALEVRAPSGRFVIGSRHRFVTTTELSGALLQKARSEAVWQGASGSSATRCAAGATE